MHLAVVLPDFTGHLNAGCTLVRAIKSLGHRVTLVAGPVSEVYARRAGIDFAPLETPGLEDAKDKLSRVDGFAALSLTFDILIMQGKAILKNLPKILEELKENGTPVDALLLDEVIFAPCATVAQDAKVPYAFISSSVAGYYMDNPHLPPIWAPWSYNESWFACCRNTMGHSIFEKWVLDKVLVDVNRYRTDRGMPLLTRNSRHSVFNDCVIHMPQQPSFFEFYTDNLPNHFFYTTPWHMKTSPWHQAANLTKRDKEGFPWDKLNGKPIVYASLGTVQIGVHRTYWQIAQACQGLNVQLVISLGKAGARLEPIKGLDCHMPLDAVVVDYCPQLQLLEKASIVISHCGCNTAMESLVAGLPIIAIPVANDQPGVAARLCHLGTAVMAASSPAMVTTEKLQSAIQIILSNDAYKKNAKECQRRILEESPTLEQTAKLLVAAFQHNKETGTPFGRDNEQAIKILKGRSVFYTTKELRKLSMMSQTYLKKKWAPVSALIPGCVVLLGAVAIMAAGPMTRMLL